MEPAGHSGGRGEKTGDDDEEEEGKEEAAGREGESWGDSLPHLQFLIYEVRVISRPVAPFPLTQSVRSQGSFAVSSLSIASSPLSGRQQFLAAAPHHGRETERSCSCLTFPSASTPRLPRISGGTNGRIGEGGRKKRQEAGGGEEEGELGMGREECFREREGMELYFGRFSISLFTVRAGGTRGRGQGGEDGEGEGEGEERRGEERRGEERRGEERRGEERRGEERGRRGRGEERRGGGRARGG
eukprot:766666-Hanusia_phi.AAC.7